MDIKVNDAEWAALGKDDQTRIEGIVTGFFKGGKIVPDHATAKSAAQPKAADLANSVCTAACDITQAAASAACLLLGNPIAIAACMALAKAGGDECRKLC
jgi:hypothetical protein